MTVGQTLPFRSGIAACQRAEIDARVAEIARSASTSSLIWRARRPADGRRQQKSRSGRGLVRSDVAAILFDEPLT